MLHKPVFSEVSLAKMSQSPSVTQSYSLNVRFVRLEVLTAVRMNMAVFWVVAPCSLIVFIEVSEMPAVSIIRAIISPQGANLGRHPC
jgi:hypothetical protein